MLWLLSITAHGLSFMPTRASAPRRVAARMVQAAPPAGFEWGVDLDNPIVEDKGLDLPSIIVGGGRIGSLLEQLGCEGDVLVRRGEPIPAEPAEGPIYVCTRNDALSGIIERTPPGRRKDLVFLQNGMLGDFLAAQGLPDASQVLVYLAVAKLGEAPTDGITDVNPEGLTTTTGRWAEAFQARLAKGELTCHVLQGDAYTKCMLEKHIWICAFMLVGALNGGVTVGEVEHEHLV